MHAQTLLVEAGISEKPMRIGVTRWYATRHGKGPLPMERRDCAHWIADDDNGPHEFQGDFRVGDLDLDLLRYSIKTNGGLDGIALTHLDKADGPTAQKLVIKVIEKETGVGVPIVITSHSKTASGKEFRA